MKLNLKTPVNDLGYGVVGLNLLKSLTSLECEVSLFPFRPPTGFNSKDFSVIQKTTENSYFYDKYAPCVRIWHQNDLAEFIGKGKHIGFPIFELDGFDKVETHHLSNCDELFVCSSWAKRILEENNITPPVSVVPCGVDRDIFHENPGLQIKNKFIVFSCGKFEYRKGHDVLPYVFNSAFSEIPDAELWVAFDNPFYDQPGMPSNNDWKQEYRKILGDKVRFIPRMNTQKELARMMNMSSVGIFLSRAEGWNLEALEMLSCGKPIVITDYSAHTEFCTSENSHLIKVTEKEIANDNIWFRGDKGRWAKLTNDNLENAIFQLRYLYENRYLNEKGIETAKKFSWESSATRLMESL